MNAKPKRIGSNLKKIDSHVITHAEYGELPEVTPAMLERAEYSVDGKPTAHPRRRGPQKTPKKIPLSLRLSPEVVQHFRTKGRSWHTDIDEALKKFVDSDK